MNLLFILALNIMNIIYLTVKFNLKVTSLKSYTTNLSSLLNSSSLKSLKNKPGFLLI